MHSIQIFQLPHGQDLELPSYQSPQAAGMDLLAAVRDTIEMAPMERKLIPCGFQMALPANFEAQIRPRSGLALKQGLTVLNAPGTIDADYRGEVQVLLVNLGSQAVSISRGMRIAQMIISPVVQMRFEPVGSSQELGSTLRGVGGFGSTGTHAG